MAYIHFNAVLLIFIFKKTSSETWLVLETEEHENKYVH